jgi:NAD(P)-dependent dehydrogenase (short-subunit alcohol dehydrogenase family)
MTLQQTSSEVVVITGASAGVGRATSNAYARRGARLALLARGAAGLEGARREARELGAEQVLTVPTDVSDAAAVDAAAARVVDELGVPDVWVNNAMVSAFGPVKELTAEEFRQVTEVTYLGVVHGTLAALRLMLPRDRGVIVQVGSALAYRGIPLQAPYCAAKHAIQGFHDSLRAELIHDDSNVRTTMVQMPALNTPQFGWVRTRLPNHPQPVPPIYQPEVAAEAIMWAAQHTPRELTVGAPTLFTTQAQKVLPGALDAYLAHNAVDSQQTDEPIDPQSWRDNLFAPVDDERDHGAHGIFDDQAHGRSVQLWATTHKAQLAAAVGAAGALGSLLLRGRTS